jgi:hypothetical protein
VLQGTLVRQERMCCKALRAQGLVPRKRVVLGLAVQVPLEEAVELPNQKPATRAIDLRPHPLFFRHSRRPLLLVQRVKGHDIELFLELLVAVGSVGGVDFAARVANTGTERGIDRGGGGSGTSRKRGGLGTRWGGGRG